MSGESKPEGEMTREIPLPPTFPYLKSTPIPPCWYCRCIDCCCGWMRPNAQPCKVRLWDCLATFMLWKNGAYVGGNFDRNAFERTFRLRVIPADVEGKSGVYSMDTTIPSVFEPGLQIRVRIFKPKQSEATKRILLFIHGGGL